MLSQKLIVWYAGAILFGALVAWTTVSIFRRCAPTGTTRQYWADVGKDIHGLLYGDEGNFWSHYVNLIRQTGKYVGQQLLAVVIAFAPLVVAFYLLGPWVFSLWDGDADPTVVPENAGILLKTPSQLDGVDITEMKLTLSDGIVVNIPAGAGSVAVCEPGRFACFVLQGFGFTAITVQANPSASRDVIVIRTAHDDWNPLWPYLSDPEFLFFLTLSLSSIVFFARKQKSKKQGTQEYAINLVDYVLTLVATRNMNFMRRLGDLETRLYAKRLKTIPISKPIFITGLARAGTTILLEKLSAGKGIATHRYRDFPFIMTPILWNKFLRLFGAKQTASERPHQDKIKITRDSPDAFEEPIWQHYFPHLHDATRQHVLDSETENETFAAFYRQHIQKIMLLRKGSRYLSKGNYNLTRIEYIGKIFPNAVFLIPIRHPLTHVESLVRQHELFKKYAETDPKIPNYLRAVGHYEFGPQRSPIHVTDDGANEIEMAWEKGNESLGYAVQWREVYEYIADIFNRNPELASRLRIVRFEDLCSNPSAKFAQVLDFIGMGADLSADQAAEGIEASSHNCNMSHDIRSQCWQVVENVAVRFGYSNSLDEISAFSGIPASRRDNTPHAR